MYGPSDVCRPRTVDLGPLKNHIIEWSHLIELLHKFIKWNCATAFCEYKRNKLVRIVFRWNRRVCFWLLIRWKKVHYPKPQFIILGLAEHSELGSIINEFENVKRMNESQWEPFKWQNNVSSTAFWTFCCFSFHFIFHSPKHSLHFTFLQCKNIQYSLSSLIPFSLARNII